MLKIYNTLSRKIEDFKPLNPPVVNMYTCGPTAYDYQHIGHMRRYVGDDILIRVLEFNGFKVKQVMNITDVGHLVSDSDTGEDKMEKGARKFGMSTWEIAKKFEKHFFNSMDGLNIQSPDILMHATDYIQEQIVFIQILEQKGFTYKIDDGIYFDTSKFPNYTKLSGQNVSELKEGARVGMVSGKKNPTDFALWKFSYPKGRSFDLTQDTSLSRRQMEWASPWGLGFPGWHIECSTMAIKGSDTETLDIHTGGIDHIAIHHTNEIAQAESATGKEFVKYWVHHNFLHVDGNKMSKSIGNIFTVEDVIRKGFDPLSLRYLYLQTHYRQEMNFTWEALAAAQIAYKRLIEEVAKLKNPKIGCAEYEEKFLDAINDDLNMAKALSIVWELIKSDYPDSAKAESLLKMDQVLGLDLDIAREKVKQIKIVVTPEVQLLIEERNRLRRQGGYTQADHIRNKIKKLGFNIKDTEKGVLVEKI
ncbi:MAG: cysteine--tRNA ligase [Candidatus Levybacteria bacterium]|nr:cysteine--tRNA ligase [Candidatus Levybacteria bacterium]MDZ4227872.1 cysteine--tRNA ligase [Candidatus Levybacteria bacterium]